MSSDYFSDVLLTTKQHGKKNSLSVSSENASQKMFIRNDKISETVNDSDSDGVNFSKAGPSGHLPAAIVGSNPTGGMSVCLLGVVS
jgi:hypothetical protein